MQFKKTETKTTLDTFQHRHIESWLSPETIILADPSCCVWAGIFENLQTTFSQNHTHNIVEQISVIKGEKRKWLVHRRRRCDLSTFEAKPSGKQSESAKIHVKRASEHFKYKTCLWIKSVVRHYKGIKQNCKMHKKKNVPTPTQKPKDDVHIGQTWVCMVSLITWGCPLTDGER